MLRLQVQGLVQKGRNAAAQLTASWDPRDAAEAQAEVARDLARCVEPDWSDADVRRRVEEILDAWEEEEVEGDEDDEDHEVDEADREGW